MQDMDRIKAKLDQGVRQAVVVGAGFIGLELAENLVHRGIATTVVERNKQILPPFDAEMTTPLAARTEWRCNSSRARRCRPNWSSWESACARRARWRSMPAWRRDRAGASA